MTMNNLKITFIGVGHMASAIINGLISTGMNAENITATNKNIAKLAHLDNNIIKTTDNHAAIKNADVIVLAVRPPAMQTLCESLTIENSPLIISVSASTSLQQLATWLGSQQAIVRCMPNMPATIKQAAIGAVANQQVTTAQHQSAELILTAIGCCVWLDDERQIDIVTAIAGSAPAYYFYMLDVLQQVAMQHGLTAKQATLLAAQTCAGSGNLALQSNHSFAELKQSIMSPGGLTEVAIHSMENDGFTQTMTNALQALLSRSESLKK